MRSMPYADTDPRTRAAVLTALLNDLVRAVRL